MEQFKEALRVVAEIAPETKVVSFVLGYKLGYTLALETAEKKLESYAAYLRGELTQDQLNEALNG